MRFNGGYNLQIELAFSDGFVEEMMAEENTEPVWKVIPEKTALIVVDMQRDFVEEGAVMEVPMARAMIPAMKRIVDYCRKQEIPVIYTRHVLLDSHDISPLETAYQPWLKAQGIREGHPGSEITPEIQPLPDDVVITKHRYDAFYNTRLETVIRNIGKKDSIDTLIIIGTVTNVCCESTARSAFMRDFKVAFISDANGGFDETSQNATLEVIRRLFGRVLTTDELMNEA